MDNPCVVRSEPVGAALCGKRENIIFGKNYLSRKKISAENNHFQANLPFIKKLCHKSKMLKSFEILVMRRLMRQIVKTPEFENRG
jgi:hypothetical protein